MTTIFLVEDAPEVRDMMTMFLIDESFDVTAYETAEEALTRLAFSLPDLLILDGRLPQMSGWWCLKLLRAADRTARLPVLMLTAAIDDLESDEREPPDDCTTYLAKPFDLDDLLAAIYGVLETCDQHPLARLAG